MLLTLDAMATSPRRKIDTGFYSAIRKHIDANSLKIKRVAAIMDVQPAQIYGGNKRPDPTLSTAVKILVALGLKWADLDVMLPLPRALQRVFEIEEPSPGAPLARAARRADRGSGQKDKRGRRPA